MIGYGIGNSRVEYHPKSVKKEVKVQFEFLTLNSHAQCYFEAKYMQKVMQKHVKIR